MGKHECVHVLHISHTICVHGPMECGQTFVQYCFRIAVAGVHLVCTVILLPWFH